MPGRRPLLLVAVLACLTGAITACGKDERLGQGSSNAPRPAVGQTGESGGGGGGGDEESDAPPFSVFATKNTTRVGGSDPVANAAAIAQATYPGARPRAVTLVDTGSWQDGVAAAVLMSAPVRAPILLTDDGDVPQPTGDALDALDPRGSARLRGAQVVRVGDAAEPDGLRAIKPGGDSVFETAQRIDRLSTTARGKPSESVVVAPADRPAFAVPAAGWAAKSGDSVLWVRRDEVPAATRAALTSHQQPDIYLLGPESAVSAATEDELRKLGTVTRIEGPNPVANAIAFARYRKGRFGWGVVDPGHGLVFASQRRPLDAVAAAPLSATGSYGPLLLIDDGDRLPGLDEAYLLDIQPGYERDAVRGVYNHGWLIGDEQAISQRVQARIDELLQIVPVREAPPAAGAGQRDTN
ncbi:MAG TPA: cell wall-binding repeat-containing protein [Solirubrobacteraceae bacterium]|nr:cell wall-binding repeat-containing protein [Solirubrobacteraceae bacterium]